MSIMTDTTKITLNVEGNLGYGTDQVEGMTLADLKYAVEEAITEWGEDTEVVVFQTNNQYGAKYGRLSIWETFAGNEDEED